ncbi:hypothetical protein IP84_10385 [beta proteobacterium AAP99]|nr:hypothetical protein IP84_10385 [beta proteobacterium AAP99]
MNFEHLDAAALDAQLTRETSPRWDAFYADRARPCGFFGTAPDESLHGWLESGRIPRPGATAPRAALDLGCGNGRNAVFLAQQGFAVTGVDYSATAIRWATERAAAAGATLKLRCENVFALDLPAGGFDLIYDSGCFHHIAPHRRACYVQLVHDALRPGGLFALTCFRPEGGSGLTDAQVYERGSLGGGLGYTEAQLRQHWGSALDILELRQMQKPAAGSGLFGEPFLWVMLAQKHWAACTPG